MYALSLLFVMNKLVWTINKINDHYLGLCFSDAGLYACTIPHESPESLKRSFTDYGLGTDINESFHDPTTDELRKTFSELIWKRWKGVDDYIDQNLALDLTGYSQKQVHVLKTSSMIPYGEVLSYGRLAEKAGFPRAARFVGSCMAKNRFPLIFPCHRVTRANSLGRYGNSPESSEIKRLLLEREGVDVARLFSRRKKIQTPI